jgi:hypothetical protein
LVVFDSIVKEVQLPDISLEGVAEGFRATIRAFLEEAAVTSPVRVVRCVVRYLPSLANMEHFEFTIVFEDNSTKTVVISLYSIVERRIAIQNFMRDVRALVQ